MAPPAVEIDTVAMDYVAGTRILHDISLSVEHGERVCLLGPSGSGKTTLLQLVAGFLQPTSGTIRIAGVDQTHVRPNRRNIGVVFQALALFPHMSVAANVEYGLKARRVDKDTRRKMVHEALEMVGLADFASRLPRHLSGGQQQRVAFARAIAFRPEALLLDEPFSSLDTSLRKSIRAELARLQEEVQVPTVLVTHDQQEALSFGHKLAVISHGRLEQFGTPEELYEAPKTRFTAEFLGAANLVPGTVTRTAGDLADIALPGGVATGVTIPETQAPPRAGDPVDILVRPEHLRLAPKGTGTGGCILPGTITRSTYLGESVEAEVRLGETHIVAKLPGTQPAAAGTQVDVILPDRGLRLFPVEAPPMPSTGATASLDAATENGLDSEVGV
ncbi:ABC transporter ATP-binding protein [Nocardioides sp. KR10-350]|uniref:ABC transporter ATP-binding protein n=1 Tax=Nocardioides cheoyonin TaxID=3156615 RepID=UPI0032B4DACF